MRPLAIDLYCGLGGWAEGFLSEGWRVIGFDIESFKYPGELVQRDVLSISGAEIIMRFGVPDVIVASPPCQEPSYRAMPWKRAQRLNRKGPPVKFIELFDACFRIRLESSIAARREIPLIIENVRGARRWVGWHKGRYGSFYLWGDVPADLPKTSAPKICRNHINQRNGHGHTRHLTNAAEHVKVGGDWFGSYAQQKAAGTISPGRLHGKNSPKRKMASALIAKIPFPLAQHIARCFKPELAEVS